MCKDKFVMNDRLIFSIIVVVKLCKFSFFQKVVKKRSSCPLPGLKHLKVTIHTEFMTRNSELRDPLLWCAPSVLKTLEIMSENKCPNYYIWSANSFVAFK